MEGAVKYKHVQFNNYLQKISWAMEQVDDTWELVNIIPIDVYESIAVFRKHKKERRQK